jgi:hypothetical protein
MNSPLNRRVLIVLSILALVVISTAAVAHGHLTANSADESHCPLCMAVHNAKHAVAAPVATPWFAIVQTAILVSSENIAILSVRPFPTQDRAPPQL